MSVQLIDSKIIKETQESLGKIIKKPPMTDKLLSKPPFRFLHDIVTSVIKTTGFMVGLFTDAEMNSDNVKEKDSKIAFLQKVIDIVSLVNDTTILVKPSKIIAGNDPEKTNELLQLLAKAINKKVDNNDYVNKLLKRKSKNSENNTKAGLNENHHKSKENGNDENEKHHSKSRDDKRSVHKEKKNAEIKENTNKNEPRRESFSEVDSSDKKHSSSKHKKRTRSGERDREKKSHKEQEETREKDRAGHEKSRHKDKRKHKSENEESEQTAPQDTKESSSTGQEMKVKDKKRHKPENITAEDDKLNASDSSKINNHGGKKRNKTDENERSEHRQKDISSVQNNHERMANNSDDKKTPENRSRLTRPNSARPGPPKPRSREQTNEDIGTVPNLIVDKRRGSDNDDDDDDDFITNDNDSVWNQQNKSDFQNEKIDESSKDHGILVKKIMETKKELEVNANMNEKSENKQDFIETPHKKDRDLMTKDIDKIQTLMQSSTRNINPLGKTLDFLQEDMDSMLKELNNWKEECKKHRQEFLSEQSISIASLEPLKSQLKEVNASIFQQLDLIATVKNNILENDKKISQILTSIIKN